MRTREPVAVSMSRKQNNIYKIMYIRLAGVAHRGISERVARSDRMESRMPENSRHLQRVMACINDGSPRAVWKAAAMLIAGPTDDNNPYQFYRAFEKALERWKIAYSKLLPEERETIRPGVVEMLEHVAGPLVIATERPERRVPVNPISELEANQLVHAFDSAGLPGTSPAIGGSNPLSAELVSKDAVSVTVEAAVRVYRPWLDFERPWSRAKIEWQRMLVEDALMIFAWADDPMSGEKRNMRFRRLDHIFIPLRGRTAERRGLIACRKLTRDGVLTQVGRQSWKIAESWRPAVEQDLWPMWRRAAERSSEKPH